jgi:hypothetical protein
MANRNDRHEFQALVFHVRLRDLKLKRHHFYIVLDLSAIQISLRNVLIGIPQIANSDIKACDRVHQGKQQFVLVPIVDVSDNCQRMDGELARGLVIRLYRLDCSEDFAVNWLKVLPLLGVGNDVPNG